MIKTKMNTVTTSVFKAHDKYILSNSIWLSDFNSTPFAKKNIFNSAWVKLHQDDMILYD